MATESKLKRNFAKLILIIFSGSFIYTLPYMRYYYYDAFKATFGINDLQMGIAGTWFGAISAVAYIVGGVMADKISLRVLMPISMISTGLAGLWLLTYPSPNVIIAIHIIWAFTAMMAFYPAMMKTVRLLADANEQSKAFGIFEGGRGIVNAVVMSVAVAIFGYFSAKAAEGQGVVSIVAFYSAVTIILGILNIFFLKGIGETGKDSSSGSFDFKLIGQLMKNPYLWLMVIIIFCTYMINMSWHLISPYTSLAFGTSAILAVILNSSTQYIRPFAAFASGFIGDRIGSSKCILSAEILTLVGLIILLLTPQHSSVIPIILSCLCIFASMYATQSMHFAIMEEGNFPKEGAGTAIGIICFLGYLPESFAALISGMILDADPSPSGYRKFFMILLVITVLGILTTLYWISKTKEKRAAILNKAKSLPEK